VPLRITTPTALDAGDRAAVSGLVAEAEARDGLPPLSDQALTLLGSGSVHHVVAYDDDRLAGYAQRAGDSLELVAAQPDALDPLLDASVTEGVLVWTHGRASQLAPVLERRGLSRVRILHQLRRSLDGLPPQRAVPDGVVIRAFVVGRDEADWLRVNAAAFAHHPEQGGWTRDDLTAREAEDWFDPAGFLLAHRGSELLGFHWTKVHPDGAGEVYVIGVDPSAQGLGLGPALLGLGLEHLRESGCTEVLLYVDDDNTAAMRLYERYGFSRHELDVQWQAAAPADVQPTSLTGNVSNT
jgi:mycothiol synthase